LDGEQEEKKEMDPILKEMIRDVETLKEDVGYSRDGSSIDEGGERFISAFGKAIYLTSQITLRSSSFLSLSLL